MSNRSGMDRPGNSDHLEDELNLAAGIRHRLGEMLLQAGRISHDVLVSAIAEQRQRGEKLGRVLLRLGLDIGELDVALEFQQRQDAGAPGFGLLRLGEIMVSTGQITREQMAASLSRQRLSGKKFGDIWMVDEMRIETVTGAAGGTVKSSTRMQIQSVAD